MSPTSRISLTFLRRTNIPVFGFVFIILAEVSFSVQDGVPVMRYATRKDAWHEDLDFDYGLDDVKSSLSSLEEKLDKMAQAQVEAIVAGLQTKWMSPMNERLDQILQRLQILEDHAKTGNSCDGPNAPKECGRLRTHFIEETTGREESTTELFAADQVPDSARDDEEEKKTIQITTIDANQDHDEQDEIQDAHKIKDRDVSASPFPGSTDSGGSNDYVNDVRHSEPDANAYLSGTADENVPVKSGNATEEYIIRYLEQEQQHFNFLSSQFNASCGRLEGIEAELRSYWKTGMANYRALWDKMAGIELEVKDMKKQFHAMKFSIEDAVSEANLERLDYQREVLREQKDVVETTLSTMKDIGIAIMASYSNLNGSIMEVIDQDKQLVDSIQSLMRTSDNRSVVCTQDSNSSEKQAGKELGQCQDVREQSDSCTDKRKKNVLTNSIFSNSSNCIELLAEGMNETGVYSVSLKRFGRTDVYCDMITDGGGWLVIQRRGNFRGPSVNFNRDWDSYKDGFGNIDGEFWLGNDLIHQMTSREPTLLRVELEDAHGNHRYAIYDTFRVDDESRSYRLHVGGYSGTAGDSLSEHNLQKFTTFDQDNDNRKSLNCAALYKGGWWYNGCGYAKLNGFYYRDHKKARAGQGIIWFAWKGWTHSMKFAEMKIRPRSL